MTYSDLDILVDKLGPLMKYKGDDIPRPGEEKLDLRDEVTEKKYVEFGPEHERLPVLKYRERVEATIRELVSSNFVLQKLQMGMDITNAEIEQLGNILERAGSMGYGKTAAEGLRQQARKIHSVHQIYPGPRKT